MSPSGSSDLPRAYTGELLKTLDVIHGVFNHPLLGSSRRVTTELSSGSSLRRARWPVAGRLPVGTKACVDEHEVALGQGPLQADTGEHGDSFQEPRDPTADAAHTGLGDPEHVRHHRLGHVLTQQDQGGLDLSVQSRPVTLEHDVTAGQDERGSAYTARGRRQGGVLQLTGSSGLGR